MNTAVALGTLTDLGTDIRHESYWFLKVGKLGVCRRGERIDVSNENEVFYEEVFRERMLLP